MKKLFYRLMAAWYSHRFDKTGRQWDRAWAEYNVLHRPLGPGYREEFWQKLEAERINNHQLLNRYKYYDSFC